MSLALRATLLVALTVALARPAAAATSVAAASPSVTTSASGAPAGMRILVRFRADATAAQIDDALHSVNGWIDDAIPQLGVTRIALPGGSDDAFGDGAAVAAVLAKHPAVVSAEPDRAMRLSFTPNDTFYGTDPFSGLGEWGIRKALIDQAWDKVRGSASITVATLDTGADLGHPDLQGVLVPGIAKLSQPSSECGPNATTRDDDGHGTHVAGIIGAAGNNGAGIAGVAFGVKVMPIKVLDCTGLGDMSDVAAGLVWAVDHGARVVNVSLGAPFDVGDTLHSAITYAVSHNVLVVAAAGNCGTLIAPCTSLNQLDYPAAYPEVLTVTATDVDDSLTFFSSRNSSVDIAAPGRRIVSTTPTYATYLSTRVAGWTLSYGALSGTSQATPFVSGLAALIWSGEPALTAQQVYQRIETTADQIQGAQGTRNDGYGFGRINALRAVTVAAKPATTPPSAPSGGIDGAAYAPAAAASFPILVPGGRTEVAVTLTNTGTSTWQAGGLTPVHAAAHVRDAKGNSVIWDGVRTVLPADVVPGGKVDLKVAVDAPLAPGPYRARIDLVREGVAWFSTLGVPTSDVDLLVAPDYRAAFPGSGSLTVSRAAPSTAVTITNKSVATWTTSGAAPVDLGVHWYDAAGNVLLWDGPRTPLPGPLAPDQSVTVTVQLGAIPPGSAFLVIDLVSEGIAWFGQGPLRQVTLTP